MNSRERILSKLRAAQTPFQDVPTIAERRHMVNVSARTPDELKAYFAKAARGAGCQVYEPANHAEALDAVRCVISPEDRIMAWDWEAIGLPGLAEALASVTLAPLRDDPARVGLTGVQAALASTGSLIVTSGAGQARQASLLPPVHLAIVRTEQIVADLEGWFALRRAEGLDAFRQWANVVIITGPSRTADIAMELILGMHGPREVHVIVI
ncbi:MAG: lactate utilization protein [Anaerolineae bacterium]|nr:lactate utilization protein [Anaerolineae bacterium]